MKITKKTKKFLIIVAVGCLLASSLLPLIAVRPQNLFADIAFEHPLYEALSFLKDKESIDVYTDGSFRPNEIVTRVGAIKMIFKAAGIEIDPYDTDGKDEFSDTKEGMWYIPYVKAATKFEISNGTKMGLNQTHSYYVIMNNYSPKVVSRKLEVRNRF